MIKRETEKNRKKRYENLRADLFGSRKEARLEKMYGHWGRLRCFSGRKHLIRSVIPVPGPDPADNAGILTVAEPVFVHLEDPGILFVPAVDRGNCRLVFVCGKNNPQIFIFDERICKQPQLFCVECR